MKKIFKSAVSLMMVFTLLACCLAIGAPVVSAADEPIYTIGCISDIHCATNTSNLRTNVVDTINKLGATEDLDMVLVGGDIASNYSSNYSQESWEAIRDELKAKLPNAFSDPANKYNVLYVAGNHEYDLCKSAGSGYNSGDYYTNMMLSETEGMGTPDDAYYGAVASSSALSNVLLAYHYQQYCSNGTPIHFVVMNAGSHLYDTNTNYTYNTEVMNWCADKVDEIYDSDPNALVIFLAHIPFNDSKGLRSNYGLTNEDALLKSKLAKYPNLIYVYGHDHQMDNACYKTEVAQRVTQYYLDSSGNATTTATANPGFISAFMGSMGYYSGSLSSSVIGFVDETVLYQSLIIYVYEDRVVLDCKNFGPLGTQYTQHSSSTSLTVNTDIAEYTHNLSFVDVPATAINIVQDNLNINTGSGSLLSTIFTPTGVTNTSVTWTSSDKSVATVSSSGYVTGVGEGECTITATAASGVSDTCTVNVSTVYANGIELNTNEAKLTVGRNLVLEATVTPTSTYDKSVIWESDNRNVATVSNGVVTPVGAGSCTITAKVKSSATGYVSAACAITVVASTANTAYSLKTDHVAYLNVINGEYLKPNDNLSRLDLALSVYNLLDDTTKSAYANTEIPYTDLGATYYSPEEITAVKTLYGAGIFDGTPYAADGATYFRPNTGVTRGELCKIITNFTGICYTNSIASKYSDVTASDYAESIYTALNYNWIHGFSDGTFCPDLTVSRIQFVTAMNAVLNRSVKKVYVTSGMEGNVNYFADVDEHFAGYVSLYEATTSHTAGTITYNGKIYEEWSPYAG